MKGKVRADRASGRRRAKISVGSGVFGIEPVGEPSYEKVGSGFCYHYVVVVGKRTPCNSMVVRCLYVF